MVRLIPGAARSGNGHCADDLAIARRVLVEVDDGKEIRGDACLVTRPYIESPWFSLIVTVMSGELLRSSENWNQHGQCPHQADARWFLLGGHGAPCLLLVAALVDRSQLSTDTRR